MGLYARAKEPFLWSFLKLSNGLPSRDTLRRPFPEQFRAAFQRFMTKFTNVSWRCRATAAEPIVEADHGRIETRTAMVSTHIDWLQKDHQWPGLAAIGKVVRIREAPDKTSTETAYYLLSQALSAERFNEVVRQHSQWTPQSGCSPTHGDQRHAERYHQRLPAWPVQARRLGRYLSHQPAGPILKCDYPVRE